MVWRASMWPHMASLREWPHGPRSSICVRLRRLRDHPTLFRMTHDSLMGRRHALSADPSMDTLEERPGDRDTVDPTATRQCRCPVPEHPYRVVPGQGLKERSRVGADQPALATVSTMTASSIASRE